MCGAGECSAHEKYWNDIPGIEALYSTKGQVQHGQWDSGTFPIPGGTIPKEEKIAKEYNNTSH